MNHRVLELVEKMLCVIPDKTYIALKYRYKTGKSLKWNNIKTFNEKLQWLKVNDRNPENIKMVDKVLAKEYVGKIIGEEFIIPSIGVWNNCDEINYDELPNKFVIKTNNDSGGVFICRDKAHFDWDKIKIELNGRLNNNYFYYGREWPYKKIKPQILVEKLLENNELTDESPNISDYKFMVFNGKVKCIFVCTERGSKDGLKVTFFDPDWNELPFERHYKKSKVKIKRPQQLDEMIEISEKIAYGKPFERIDLYEVNGKIFFGEITLYPGSGFEEFRPDRWDEILGEWLELPQLSNCCK